MLSSTLERVFASTHFAQNPFMSFQFPISRCVDGYPLFQQIENHLADGVDLIFVGVFVTSVDVYFDWLLSGRASGKDVVVATASSFTSMRTSGLVYVLFIALHLRLKATTLSLDSF